MRTLKGLRKRKPTFTVAKWLVRFYGFSLLSANEVEVAFVEDVVSGMPDDERFRKFIDCSRQLYRPISMPDATFHQFCGLKVRISIQPLPMVASRIMHI